MHLTERIEEAMPGIMKQISSAAARQDVIVLEFLTRQASELQAIKQQMVALERRFEDVMAGDLSNGGKQGTSGAIRELIVQVTQGMINQNLLTLTEHVKRGVIRAGEALSVEVLPSGDRFDTQLLANGNKLHERGKIGKFYRESGIKAGDTVGLSEITPGKWRLRKVDRFKRVEEAASTSARS